MLQPYPPRARPPPVLTLHASIPRETSCCFGNPPPFFRNGQRQRLSSTTFRMLGQSDFMMAEKARRFHDHRALELILSTSQLQSHKLIGRSVRGFENAIWVVNAKKPFSLGLLSIFRKTQRLHTTFWVLVTNFKLKAALLTRCGKLASARMTPMPMIPTCGEGRTCSGRLVLPSATNYATVRTGWHTPPLLLSSPLRYCPRGFTRLTPHR